MKEKYLFIPPKPMFTNKVIDKKELKKLMSWAFSTMEQVVRLIWLTD